MVNDMCADILSQSALKNNANNIMAIFLNKAKVGEMLATPPTDAQNRLLTALQMRSNIDATELYSLFPAFFLFTPSFLTAFTETVDTANPIINGAQGAKKYFIPTSTQKTPIIAVTADFFVSAICSVLPIIF